MNSATVTLAIAAFLSGVVTAVFVMLVAGIRAGSRRLTVPPRGRLDALTRTMLGVGVRTSQQPGGRDGGEA